MPALDRFRVFVVGKDLKTARTFNQQGSFRIVEDIEQAQIVCWIGGADVSPRLYKSDFHPSTHSDSATDERDLFYWRKAADTGCLLVGICRGGQFLNVMSGGEMYQDVDKHALSGSHCVLYKRPDEAVKPFLVTSTHHQMMKPRGKFEVWASVTRSTYRDMAGERMAPVDKKDGPDTEIVWYPETNALCFQPHPEYDHKETEDLFFICIERALREITEGKSGTNGFATEQIKQIGGIGMPF